MANSFYFSPVVNTAGRRSAGNRPRCRGRRRCRAPPPDPTLHAHPRVGKVPDRPWAAPRSASRPQARGPGGAGPRVGAQSWRFFLCVWCGANLIEPPKPPTQHPSSPRRTPVEGDHGRGPSPHARAHAHARAGACSRARPRPAEGRASRRRWGGSCVCWVYPPPSSPPPSCLSPPRRWAALLVFFTCAGKGEEEEARIKPRPSQSAGCASDARPGWWQGPGREGAVAEGGRGPWERE